MSLSPYILERFLQAGVERLVFEKLGAIFGELDEITKSMLKGEATEIKRLILELVRNSCGTFCGSIKIRIERQ